MTTPSPTAPSYYMACIDLTGRAVLVVGAGRVALEKIEGLLAAGSRDHGGRAPGPAGG